MRLKEPYHTLFGNVNTIYFSIYRIKINCLLIYCKLENPSLNRSQIVKDFIIPIKNSNVLILEPNEQSQIELNEQITIHYLKIGHSVKY